MKSKSYDGKATRTPTQTLNLQHPGHRAGVKMGADGARQRFGEAMTIVTMRGLSFKAKWRRLKTLAVEESILQVEANVRRRPPHRPK